MWHNNKKCKKTKSTFIDWLNKLVLNGTKPSVSAVLITKPSKMSYKMAGDMVTTFAKYGSPRNGSMLYVQLCGVLYWSCQLMYGLRWPLTLLHSRGMTPYSSPTQTAKPLGSLYYITLYTNIHRYFNSVIWSCRLHMGVLISHLQWYKPIFYYLSQLT